MIKKATSRGRAHAIALVLASGVLMHFLGLAQPILAAQTSGGGGGANVGQSLGSSESTSSSQPLWSYQIKPSNFAAAQVAGGGGGQPSQAHYTTMPSGAFPSLFDAFSGLSQRQGALTSSPFMSILPIILIAAGGMLLLLPFFTMMVASPFGGGGAGPFGAGYQSPFGYPQVLSKRRSLDQGGAGQRGIVELIEHFSSTIEDLSRRYSPQAPAASQQQQQQQQSGAHSKRSAKLADSATPPTPANHKAAPSGSSGSGDETNTISNLFSAAS